MRWVEIYYHKDKMYLLLWILSIGYFFIVILPYIIFGFTYIPWIISIPDLIDLIFYPPVIGLTLYAIYRSIICGKKNSLIDYFFILFLVIHFIGHGFHWAANAIHETIKHASIYDTSTISYAYFLDEVLGHKIMYYPLYFMLLLFLLEEIRYLNASYGKNYLFLNIPNGIIFGFSLIISAIEGQSPYEALALASFSILLVILFFRKSLGKVKNFPYSSFALVTSMTIVATGIIYFLIFGGFIEPSKIFK